MRLMLLNCVVGANVQIGKLFQFVDNLSALVALVCFALPIFVPVSDATGTSPAVCSMESAARRALDLNGGTNRIIVGKRVRRPERDG